MTTQAKTAWWLAMALAGMSCAAQAPTGGIPPAEGRTAGSATQTVGPQNTPIPTGRARLSPKQGKLAADDGGLTFLPELKPTDGVVSLPAQQGGDAEVAADAAAMHEKPMLLDRVVAVINGQVIMASDVQEQQRFAVFEPYSVPGGEFTPMRAMQQIVNRRLLTDQMDEQELVAPPTDADVDKEIARLRQHIPACAGQHCETEEGWRRFLAAHGYTEAELHARWKQRMQILNFVSARFRTGIRITKPEIEAYYKEKLVPEFENRKLKPPPLAQVSDRIDEVLLQQHVNVLLRDYLLSLKDAGSVQILDPQYNSLGNSPATNANNSSPDLPGPPVGGPARHGGGEQ